MSKYSIARAQLGAAVAAGEAEAVDTAEVLEAVIVTAVQDLIAARGRTHTRSVLSYELDNVGTDGVMDIQKR